MDFVEGLKKTVKLSKQDQKTTAARYFKNKKKKEAGCNKAQQSTSNWKKDISHKKGCSKPTATRTGKKVIFKQSRGKVGRRSG